MIYFQQGDVLAKECSSFKTEIPENLELKLATLLYQGAMNSHAFSSGKVLMGDVGDRRYFRVEEDAELSHAEHNPVGGDKKMMIPKGDYFLDVVLEYDHLLEESRRIID